MKKLLLLATLVVSFSAFAGTMHKSLTPAMQKNHIINRMPAKNIGATRASSGSIDFTYAGDPYYAFYVEGNNVELGKSRIYMMFEMAADDIKACAGNEVTAVTVFSPTDNDFVNPVADGEVFYSTDGVSAAYTQKFNFKNEGLSTNVITLDKPYKITGEEESLYFGYSIIVPSRKDVFYVVSDANPTDDPNTSMYGISNDDSFPTEFDAIGDTEGALCISITITGDNLPENIVKIAYLESPFYIPLSGDGANVNFIIRNCGANALTSVEAVTSVEGMDDVVETLTFPAAAYNEYVGLTAKGIKAKTAGYPELKLQITKVNGVDVTCAPFYAMAPAYDGGYDMKIVAEDATGTWCGWCPGGIEALEYLKATYPDRAIPIGVHYGDAMQIDSYMPVIQAFVSGFPTILYNRVTSQTPTNPYTEMCAELDAIVNALDFPTYGKIDMTGTSNEEGTEITLTTKTQFSLNTEMPHFISFVIVEDGVGPYRQSNYFSSYGVPMNGWEKASESVKTVYNDVARYTNEFPGIEGSLPETIEEDKEYEFTYNIPLLSGGSPIVTKDTYRVIALVTNLYDGRIVNACQIPMTNKLNGVQEINDAAKETIRGGVGEVLVEGADSYNVYTLTGCKVNNGGLLPGLYIVTAGDKTEKVFVK